MDTSKVKLFEGKRPLCFNTIRFPRQLRILALAPHPDDFDEIGVTMRFFRDNGNPLYVAVLSSGAGGVQDAFCSPATTSKKTAIREKEQRASCSFFGLTASHLTFLRLQEDDSAHPLDSRDNFERIRRYFMEKRPDMVFLPHGNDINSGHQRTYKIFREIAARAGYPITACLNRDPKTIRMRHDLYTLFGEDEARWKAELLRFHQSQQQRNLNTRRIGFDERILSLNRRIAAELGGKARYAEAFELEFREVDGGLARHVPVIFS